ncbi:MAG: hypothetical protein J7513_07850 [Solirubrobacteraceae bacterium]|nr:hypothetical protein [Solirubrobacteraceae bacterium]
MTANQGSTDVIYYLDLHAGATDERFSVLLRPGAFATEGRSDEGQSVDGPLQFGLYGPGTVGSTVSDPAIGRECSAKDRTHGYATGNAVVDLALPAGANTTLAVRYGIGRRAPWVDTDLRLRFGFQQKLIGDYPATSPLAGAATSVAGIASSGVTPAIPVESKGSGKRIGAHLLLSTSPRGSDGTDGGKPRSLKLSSRVKVSGRLLPALAGKRVQLQWAKSGGTPRTAATVKTTRRGRFSARLRAPARGTYELWASYPSQAGPLRSDSTSCPIVYRVR